MTAVASIIAVVAIGVCLLMACGMLVWNGVREFARQMGFCGVLLAAAFLYCMAVKPPVTFDDYLRNNGTHYTNDYATVAFRWVKTSSAVADTVPLHIARKPNGGSAWQTVATTTVGAKAYDYNTDTTNYTWYVWSDYMPPVHTNGVWLGNVIEKAKGDKGLNKLIIINGRLYHNGVEIAPKGE